MNAPQSDSGRRLVQRVTRRQLELCGCEVKEPARRLDHAVDAIWMYVRQTYSANVPKLLAVELHSHEFFLPPQAELNVYSDGASFIAIDYRLLNFIYGLNDAICRGLVADSDGTRDVSTFDSLARRIVGQFFRFNDALVSFVDEAAGPLNESDTFGDYRFQQARRSLGYGQTVFLLAHEYSHYLFGHAGTTGPIVGPDDNELPYRSIQLDTMTDVQIEELEADRLAADIALGVLAASDELNTLERNLAVAGIDLLLSAFHIAEQVSGDHKHFSLQSVLMGGTGEMSDMLTHPSAEQRRSLWLAVSDNRRTAQAIKLSNACRKLLFEAVDWCQIDERGEHHDRLRDR